MSAATPIYGLMAGFETQERLLAATRVSYAEGYRHLEAYSPFPVEGLAEALGHRATSLPLLVLAAGMAGGGGGYLMAWYLMAVDYPLNIGGRPFNSWPMFVPIAFELAVLAAAITAFTAAMILNGLPRLYHPVFNVPEFGRASRDRFFLCIVSQDAKFDPTVTRRFLESLQPYFVSEVQR